MNKNLHFEDIKEGMEIPTIKKNPTTQQLVKYAGASGDFYQIHYDMEYAKNNGLPGVILHGAQECIFGTINYRLDWYFWQTKDA